MGHRTDPLRIERPSSPKERRGRITGRKDAVDIVRLIRSIQREQRQSECFCTGQVDCDEIRCPWREYCLD